jgi:hypothetical protein
MLRRVLLSAATMAIVLAMSPAAATAHHQPHHGPGALLSLDGGPAIPGVPAHPCLPPRDAECSPLDEIPFSGGEDAEIRSAVDSVRIIRWKIVYSAYPVGDTMTLSRSGPSDGTKYRKIDFTAPPPGDWRVFAWMTYERADGDRGQATYEWRLSSEPPDSATSAVPVAGTVAGGGAGTPLLIALPVLAMALGVFLVMSHRVRRRA